MAMHDEEDKKTAFDPYAHPTGVQTALPSAQQPQVDPGHGRSAPVPEPAAENSWGGGSPAALDPYAGPTGFVGFGQIYGANAGAAKAGAAKLEQGAADAAAKARKTLGEDESGLTKALGVAGNGSLTEGWSGPDVYNPSGNTYAEYADAQQKVANLGSTAGVQESMGPGTSMFSAAITRHAGGQSFHDTQDAYAGLGDETGAAAARGATAIGDAKTARQATLDRVAVESDAQKRDIEEQDRQRRYQDYVDARRGLLSKAGGIRTVGPYGEHQPLAYDAWLKQQNGGK